MRGIPQLFADIARLESAHAYFSRRKRLQVAWSFFFEKTGAIALGVRCPKETPWLQPAFFTLAKTIAIV
jgi:hypothetical protein